MWTGKDLEKQLGLFSMTIDDLRSFDYVSESAAEMIGRDAPLKDKEVEEILCAISETRRRRQERFVINRLQNASLSPPKIGRIERGVALELIRLGYPVNRVFLTIASLRLRRMVSRLLKWFGG